VRMTGVSRYLIVNSSALRPSLLCSSDCNSIEITSEKKANRGPRYDVMTSGHMLKICEEYNFLYWMQRKRDPGTEVRWGEGEKKKMTAGEESGAGRDCCT
jgi:hypothetical protein